jgi:hypothetical protein
MIPASWETFLLAGWCVYQGSYSTCREESNSRTLKDIYQQIQGLNADEKGLEISKI